MRSVFPSIYLPAAVMHSRVCFYLIAGYSFSMALSDKALKGFHLQILLVWMKLIWSSLVAEKETLLSSVSTIYRERLIASRFHNYTALQLFSWSTVSCYFCRMAGVCVGGEEGFRVLYLIRALLARCSDQHLPTLSPNHTTWHLAGNSPASGPLYILGRSLGQLCGCSNLNIGCFSDEHLECTIWIFLCGGHLLIAFAHSMIGLKMSAVIRLLIGSNMGEVLINLT